jgi:hypothetical protein
MVRQSYPLLTTSVTVNTYVGLPFTVGDFVGSSSLLAAFDQYKIVQIEAWIEPTAAQGSTVFQPLACAIDLDDANTPTTFSSVSDRIGALVGLGGTGRYLKWRPHVATAVYSGAFTSFANEPSCWIDSASPNVQHYGFKAAALPTVVAVTYEMTYRAVVMFRAPVIA